MKTSGFVLLVLLSTTSFAVKKDPSGRLLQPDFRAAPECQERPEFLSEIRTDFLGGLSRLPETVLVAREAEYYVESREGAQPVKVHGYQSFLQKGLGSTQVVCGNSSAEAKGRFSLYAPTLIDTKKKSQVGQSLWQFQMMLDNSKYSFWNMKSPSFKQNEALDSWLTSSGATYKVFQKSHNEYELLLVKSDKDVTQYLSIIYDAVPNLK